MYAEDDYYAVLELSRNASEAEIKKAYRRMALRWHPDKNQSSQTEAERRFKLISEAYEVLSDPEKRRVYDEFGKAGLAERESYGSDEHGFEQQQQHYQQQHYQQQRRYQHGDYHFRDPRDVFREFFGPGDPFSRIFYNPDRFTTFDESMRNIGDRHRTTNNVSGFASRFGAAGGFGGGGGSSDFFSDFMSMGPGQSSRISMGGAGTGFSSRLQPLHSARVTRTFTNTVGGRRVVVHQVTENGVETVTKTVDGVITEQTVNGHPVSIGDDWKAQVTAN